MCVCVCVCLVPLTHSVTHYLTTHPNNNTNKTPYLEVHDCQHCSTPYRLPRRSMPTMCNVTKNYYIYEQCLDPGLHFTRTSMDGEGSPPCSKGPHERYIVQPGTCPLCHR